MRVKICVILQKISILNKCFSIHQRVLKTISTVFTKIFFNTDTANPYAGMISGGSWDTKD